MGFISETWSLLEGWDSFIIFLEAKTMRRYKIKVTFKAEQILGVIMADLELDTTPPSMSLVPS